MICKQSIQQDEVGDSVIQMHAIFLARDGFRPKEPNPRAVSVEQTEFHSRLESLGGSSRI
jgi:hypothetical protein